MKFSYRGVHYETEPSRVEVAEAEIGGTYRGQNWRIHVPRQFLRHQATHKLMYRGVPYRH